MSDEQREKGVEEKKAQGRSEDDAPEVEGHLLLKADAMKKGGETEGARKKG